MSFCFKSFLNIPKQLMSEPFESLLGNVITERINLGWLEPFYTTYRSIVKIT